jgi:hypothetical protein
LHATLDEIERCSIQISPDPIFDNVETVKALDRDWRPYARRSLTAAYER